jgi:hypothetical protein
MALAKRIGMDTTKTHGADVREVSGRMGAWLICMALVTVASGCGGCQAVIREPLPEGTPSTPVTSCPGGPNCGISQALLAAIDETNCPTGNCDPGGSGNAKGIYTAEGGNYCFKAMGEQYFCPEAFINTPEGVVLDVRYLNNPRHVIKTKVSGRLKANPNTFVDVLSITGDRTELAIKYRIKGQAKEYTVKGAELGNVILSLGAMAMGSGDASPLIGYELRFSAHKPPNPDPKVKDKAHRYKLEYRDVAAGPGWLQHCEQDGVGAVVAFLGGRRVSGVTASITEDPKVTTMGCEQGSIVTCMAWGYSPWEPGAGTGVSKQPHDFVYRSCLQAKRAAYFVGKGDFQSYTVKGTNIIKWDQYGFGGDDLTDDQKQKLVPRIEALWGPHGAVCFNKENRRRKDADAWKGQDPNNLNTYGVPPCTSQDYTEAGKFFTALPL